ncbi:MAG TPA: flagellar protein FlgN [Nitrospirae bacterium]|nr:flagellar protein FlgN [Nitrospirota bacterium]
MSLTRHISEMADVLSRNIELYEQMAEQLDKERHDFVSHSVENLNKNLKLKEVIVLKLRTLEETRQRVVRSVAKVVEVDKKELTLLKLIELATGPLKERLTALRQKLREVIEKTNELNYFNRGLIERLIKLNYAAAERLQNLIEPEDTYVRHGKAGSNLKSGRIVEQTF